MSGDAVATDGSLKDASEIEWFNDADDEVPMQRSSRHLGSTTALTSAQSLDKFFSSRAPAKKVGGARQSSRTRKPSRRAVDPDNAEGPDINTGSGGKWKTADSSSSCRVSRKVVLSDERLFSQIYRLSP